MNIIITINRGGEIEALRMSANTRLTTCHYLAISCHGEATFPDVIISQHKYMGHTPESVEL